MDRFLTSETLVFLIVSSITWALIWLAYSHKSRPEELKPNKDYYRNLFGNNVYGHIEAKFHPSIAKGKLSSAGLHRAGYFINHGIFVSLNGLDAVTNLFRLLTLRPLMGKVIVNGKFFPQECEKPGLSIELRDVECFLKKLSVQYPNLFKP